MFEAVLQKQQMEAQLRRLKQQIQNLFGGQEVPSGGGTCSVSLDVVSRAGKQTGASEREHELMSTISTMKQALERAQAGVSVTKYRQVRG